MDWKERDSEMGWTPEPEMDREVERVVRMMETCDALSEQCERGIVAVGVSPVTGEPLGGIFLTGPSCLMLMLDLGTGIELHTCLN